MIISVPFTGKNLMVLLYIFYVIAKKLMFICINSFRKSAPALL